MSLIKNSFNKLKIILLCQWYSIHNYTINKDMSIDVNGDVNLSKRLLTKIPIKFNIVNGTFNCSHNNLESLENIPNIVNSDLNISYNNLTSLKGMPKEIYGSIFCICNNIDSFYGIPEDFNGCLHYTGNPIDIMMIMFANNVKCIYWLNEYNVIQGNNIIIDRLEEVCHHIFNNNSSLILIKSLDRLNKFVNNHYNLIY